MCDQHAPSPSVPPVPAPVPAAAPSSAPSGSPLATLSAEELHQICRNAHRLGIRVELRFAHALLALYETRQFVSLGFPTISAYALRHYDWRHSKTYDCITTTRALRRLPRLARAIESGELAWSRAVEIARVAGPETEEEWLRFSGERTFARLRAEVREAARHGRSRPRKNEFGLPRMPVRLVFDLSPEDAELAHCALGKGRRELSGGLGVERQRAEEPGGNEGEGEAEAGVEVEDRVDGTQALLYILRRFLETDPAGTPAGRVEREEPLSTLVYHLCLKCQRGQVETDDGPVEVPGEVIERVEMESRKVEILPKEEVAPGSRSPAQAAAPAAAQAVGPGAGEPEGAPRRIDRPNTPEIRRKVIHRDGRRCGNPCCRRKLDLQAHHIRYRRLGGRTAVWNEVAVCLRCHALIHLSLLEIRIGPEGELQWIPRSVKLDHKLKAEEAELVQVPVVVATAVPGTPSGTPAESAIPESGLKESGKPDSGMPEPARALVRALRALGYRRREAEERVAGAIESLKRAGARLTEAAVLRRALSSAS